MNLKEIGWNEYFAQQYEIFSTDGLVAGRVVKESRHLYQVYTDEGLVQAEVSGSFHYTAIEKSDYPTVGDWVVVRKADTLAIIEKVLSRKSFFARKAAGDEVEQQVVAANIDYICIVCGLDGGRNFNLRGLERYIAMVQEGKAQPVIVLNKVDLCNEREEARLRAASVAKEAPIFMVSALSGEGLEAFSLSFNKGTTLVFTGSSGVGKSALLNALMGNAVQKTGLQRTGDKRGRHTTTHKELFFLAGGAMVIDTPGMRELQLWGSAQSLEDTFREIYAAAKKCRFRDCSHQGEPGCAVQQLLIEGVLDFERYQNFLDMRAELAFLESRLSESGRQERKKREKELSKKIRRYSQDR